MVEDNSLASPAVVLLDSQATVLISKPVGSHFKQALHTLVVEDNSLSTPAVALLDKLGHCALGQQSSLPDRVKSDFTVCNPI